MLRPQSDKGLCAGCKTAFCEKPTVLKWAAYCIIFIIIVVARRPVKHLLLAWPIEKCEKKNKSNFSALNWSFLSLKAFRALLQKLFDSHWKQSVWLGPKACFGFQCCTFIRNSAKGIHTSRKTQLFPHYISPVAGRFFNICLWPLPVWIFLNLYLNSPLPMVPESMWNILQRLINQDHHRLSSCVKHYLGIVIGKQNSEIKRSKKFWRFFRFLLGKAFITQLHNFTDIYCSYINFCI